MGLHMSLIDHWQGPCVKPKNVPRNPRCDSRTIESDSNRGRLEDLGHQVAGDVDADAIADHVAELAFH